MDFDSDQESITPHQKSYVKIDTTGALWLPTGTTAQRPGSPSPGLFRYNTDTPGLEFWDGSAWTAVGGGGGGGGPNSFTATASVALTAGQFVNAWSDGGTPSVRLADSALGYPADGYITASYSIGNTVTVYTEGNNASLTGMTVGDIWLGLAGTVTATIPTPPSLVQRLGFAFSATTAGFAPSVPVQT